MHGTLSLPDSVKQILLQMHSDDQVLVRFETERHILLELIEGII